MKTISLSLLLLMSAGSSIPVFAQVTSDVKQAGEKTGDVAKDGAKDTVKGAKKVGKATKKGAKKVGKATADGADKVTGKTDAPKQ